MALLPLEIFKSFLFGDRLYMAESDVYRCQKTVPVLKGVMILGILFNPKIDPDAKILNFTML